MYNFGEIIIRPLILKDLSPPPGHRGTFCTCTLTAVVPAFYGFIVFITILCLHFEKERYGNILQVEKTTQQIQISIFPAESISFVNVLQSSLLGVQTSPAWCENCNKFQPTVIKCRPFCFNCIFVCNSIM
jgi:hypothetical protein